MAVNDLNSRQERFAQNLARGMTQVDAYRDAQHPCPLKTLRGHWG